VDFWVALFAAGGPVLSAVGLQRAFKLMARPLNAALQVAAHSTRARGHRRVTVEHVALALLSEPAVARGLEARGVALKELYDDVEALLPSREAKPTKGPIPLAEDLTALIRTMGLRPFPERMLDRILASEHGLLRRVFEKHGVSARQWHTRAIRSPPPSPASAPNRTRVGAEEPTDVILWNDKQSTMALVLEVLHDTFGLVEPHATRTMLTARRDGRSVVGTYDAEEARALAAEAAQVARRRALPLKVTLEPSRREPTRA
jgi:ATP-dependent Clp protease adapter protein ClpS